MRRKRKREKKKTEVLEGFEVFAIMKETERFFVAVSPRFGVCVCVCERERECRIQESTNVWMCE